MKILIPLDGSQFAEAVLKPAADLAAAAKAEVHLIEVVRPSEAKDIWAEVPPHNPQLY
jgi:nucleotide-binding universal stress UspA family protein